MSRIPDASTLGARPTPAAQTWGPGPDYGAVIQANRGIARSASELAANFDQSQAEDEFGKARAQFDQWHIDNVSSPDTGIRAFKGQDALQLPQTLPQKFKEETDQIIAGIKNPRARDAAQRLQAARMAQTAEAVNDYAFQQGQEFRAQEFVGNTQTLQQHAAAVAADPVATEVDLEQLGRSTRAYWRGQGLGEGALQAKVDQATEQTHAYVVSKLLSSGTESDLATADSYIARHGDQMNVGQLLELRAKAREQSQAFDIYRTVQGAIGGANAAASPDRFAQMASVVRQTESGGRQVGPDGQPITSPKGAIGINQIMPDTGPEAAKLAGVKWDEALFRTDAAYNAKLGDAYLGMLVKRYNGDETKALAAYNWGPGKVDEAIKKSPDDWTKAAPAEVMLYASGIVNQVDGGAGQPNASRRATLSQVDTALEAKYGGDLGALTKARELARTVFDLQLKEEKQAQDGALSQVYFELAKTGGVVTPTVANLMGQVDGTHLPQVRETAARWRKGEDVETNLALYGQLLSDRNLLSNVNLDALQGQLSREDRKSLTERQAKERTGGGSSMYSAQQSVNAVLAAAKIDPSPKDTDSKAWAVIGQFRKELAARAGQDPSPVDAEKAARDLLTEYAVQRKGWFGLPIPRTVRGFEFKLGDVVRGGKPGPSTAPSGVAPYQIPAAKRAEISAWLAGRNLPQDENTVQQVYRRFDLGLAQ